MQQVLSRFGKGTRQRIAAAQRLERIYRVAIATGQVARFVVFGSFITAKSEPADVDVFVLMETSSIWALDGETRVLFDHAAAHGTLWRKCVLVAPSCSPWWRTASYCRLANQA